MTNIERIRKMSVSEMAEMLMLPTTCDFCIHHESKEDCIEECSSKSEKSGIIQWLISEV